MNSNSNSRMRMIEAAISLMRQSGLSGAGINEIVRASGAPKGSVYHFFPQGKQQIVAEALTIYAQRVSEFIEESMRRRKQPHDKLLALFSAFAKRVEDAGFLQSCAVGTVSLDLDASMDELRPLLDAAFANWRQVILHQLELPENRNNKALAGLILTTIEGAYIRSRAEHSSLPFKEAGGMLAQLLPSMPQQE